MNLRKIILLYEWCVRDPFLVFFLYEQDITTNQRALIRYRKLACIYYMSEVDYQIGRFGKAVEIEALLVRKNTTAEEFLPENFGNLKETRNAQENDLFKFLRIVKSLLCMELSKED